MNRVRKQLHEWDENLKDDSLPTNVIGQPLQNTCAHTPVLARGAVTFLIASALSSPPVRLLLQSGSVSAH